MDVPPEPTVSVCMSAYDTERYVACAVASALDQTLTNIEVVVVDNGSTDGTWSAIQSFADDRVRSIRVHENCGAAGGRALAIEAARGRWVAVLDSDDFLDRDRLERLVEIGERTAADIVIDDLHLIDDGAEAAWGTLFSVGQEAPSAERRIDATAFVASDRWLQPGLRLGLAKPMVRRSFLDLHRDLRPDPSLHVVHDYWWALEMLLAGAEMILTPVPGYYYRAREGQLVSSGGELITLDQNCARARALLGRPSVAADPRLSRAVEESLAGWEEARAYLRFLAALRTRRPRTAASIARHDPRVVRTMVENAPDFLRRRLRGDPASRHMTHQF